MTKQFFTKSKFVSKAFLLFMLLSLGLQQLQAQTTKPAVSGIVRDEKGQPLPGVSVKAENAGKNLVATTVTDGNGLFSFAKLTPNIGYNFTFIYVGYENQSLTGYNIQQGETISLSVKLKEASTALAQVVVVGYGKSLRKDISSSIATVSPDDFNAGAYTSPAQILQGKVAGLNITQDGNPNARPTVLLRGPSTLNLAQQPFYVIDGVPDASIELVAPADIISIDVLKDASAAAIYGTRAANGVILVTTHKGKAGQMSVSYSAYGAMQKISNEIEVATADELRGYLAANNKALAPADDNGANIDWQKEISRTGLAQNHNLSISGGTEKSMYNASINYFNNRAIIKGSDLERFIGRLGLEQKTLNDKLKLNFNISNSVSSQSDVDPLVFYNALRFLPTLNVRNADGTFKEDLTRTQTYNPLALIESNKNDTRLKTLLASAGAQVTLPFDLTYNLNLSYQNRSTNNDQYRNRYSLLAQGANGEAIRSNYEDTKKVLETFLTYSRKFGEHDVKLLAGYSYEDNKNGNGFQSSNRGFVSDETTYYNLGLGQPPAGYVPLYGTVSIIPLRLISFYSRLNYNYNDRFLLQATLRRDGSSAFGQNNRWGYFPSVSGAWRISQENFMKQQEVFSDLKLRAGYGVTGNTIGFNPLTSLLLYDSAGSFYYSGSYTRAIGPSQNPNPDLKWEKTAQVNIGLDFGLFKNRLTGTVEVYNKSTSDIIYQYQIPSSISYTSSNILTANAGKMNNKGIELTLNALAIKRNDFEWNTSLNLSHNKNKIISLSNDTFKADFQYTGFPNGLGQSSTSTQIIKSGYPVGQFYTLHYLGRNDKGISMFEDKNGNPTILPTSADQKYLGSAQPTILFGWNNSFRYKGFDLNFFIRGVTGNKIMNATNASLNIPIDASNHNVPKLTLNEPYADNNANLYSDRYLENGAYLRLDNATLGYTLKSPFKGCKSLRFYLSGNNLFVITGYSGIDPEINLGGIEPGIDNRNYYPKTRSFLAGLKIDL